MARIPFGTTWWGKKWLDSLTLLDYENRLPRGRSYFSTGHVLSSEFDPKELLFTAKVQGSQLRPYTVKIRFPRVDREAAARFTDLVAKDPEFISSLVDDRLEPRVADVAEAAGLRLFPESWREFGLTCTCPDFAVPCKHIAAAFLAIVREIDADPLKVLSFQGFDLKKALKERGVDLERAEGFELPDARSLLRWKAKPEEAVAPKQGGAKDAETAFSAVPLYLVKPLSASLLKLLPEETALFPGGRDWLKKVWNRISKRASNAWSLRGSHTNVWDRIDKGPLGSWGPVVPRVQMFDDSLDFVRPYSEGMTPRPLSEKRASGWLFDAMLELGNEEARNHSVGLSVWYQLITIALALMKNGAVVPVLVRHPEAEKPACTLVWEPALAADSVRSVVLEGAAALESLGVRLITLPENEESTPEGRFLAILTVLITAFADHMQAVDAAARGKLVTGLFGDRYRCLEEGACDSEIHTLSRYLRPLSFYQLPTDWVPVVVVRSRNRETLQLNLGILPAKHEAGEKPILLKTILTDPEYERDRYAVIAGFQMLTSACPELAEVLKSQGKPFSMVPEDLKPFLFEARPALELLGAQVLLPKRLRKIFRPQLTAEISGTAKSSAGRFLTKEMLADFSWKVSIGSRELTEAEALQLFEKKGEIVQLDDEYVWLDPAEIEAIEKRLKQKRKPGYLERLRGALTGEIEGAGVQVSGDIMEKLREISREKEIPVPDDIRAELRPYQKRGYSWLMKNFRLGLGSLIADDMGLGKTLQVITALDELKHEGELKTGKVIAVVPATLLTNWVREIRKFAPNLTAEIYHGSDRKLGDPDKRPDVLLTTYGTLRRDSEQLSKLPWRVMVMDEAQAVKNTGTGAYAAASSFPADRVIAMTGTPVENRLMEYWSIFSIVQPGLLGTASDFRENFSVPIENEHDPRAAEAFRKLVAPFMLRRMKTDKAIISDLPDCIVQDVMTTLLPEQAYLYQEALTRNLDAISRAEANSRDKQVKRRALVLKLITELKQICNSPSQYNKQWSETPDSAKAETLFELLDECRENGRKVLVFTQYREMGELLQGWIAKKTGRKPEFLHGGVSVARRAVMVDDFQNNPDSHILLVSLKAGGTGLNLTAASVVIHYDLWWNPAVESQASDRAWRIGQQRDVLVYRFVTEGTFEERINEMLTEKRRITGSRRVERRELGGRYEHERTARALQSVLADSGTVSGAKENLMKTLKTAAACAALMMTLAGASAQAFAAGTSSQALGECLYRNATPDQKTQLIQWAYVTIGKTDAAKSVQAIPQAKTQAVTQKMKSTLTTLLLHSCPKEAAQVLLTDPKNGSIDAMETVTSLMLREKVRNQVGNVLDLQSAGGAASKAGELLKDVGSFFGK